MISSYNKIIEYLILCQKHFLIKFGIHIVESIEDGPDIFLIDKHFIHEVTSPQAFDELKRRNLKVFDPNKIIATVDHNVPTLINIFQLMINFQKSSWKIKI